MERTLHRPPLLLPVPAFLASLTSFRNDLKHVLSGNYSSWPVMSREPDRIPLAEDSKVPNSSVYVLPWKRVLGPLCVTVVSAPIDLSD